MLSIGVLTTKAEQRLPYRSATQEKLVRTIGTRITRSGDEFLQRWTGLFRPRVHGSNHAFAIPAEDFRATMESLNTTRNEYGTYYWHIQLSESMPGDVFLILPKEKINISL